MMRYVFVTGSRYADLRVGHLLWEHLWEVEKPKHQHTIVHGDCQGVDRMAARIAGVLGWVGNLPIPAQWYDFGPRAGPIRNGTLVAIADHLRSENYDVTWLAFPMGASTGTRGCIELASDAGFEVSVHELPNYPKMREPT